jgi:plastocyanin
MSLTGRRPDHWPPWLGPVLGGAAVVQCLHSMEHVAQLLQAYLLHEPRPEGLLGQWLDFEWMHFGFNLTLSVVLLIVWFGARMHRGDWRASSPVGWWTLLAATAVEVGLHLPEHFVRVYQYIRYGWSPAPGILGHTALHGSGPVDLLILHTAYNLTVGVLLVVSFLAYRWALTGRVVSRAPARDRPWAMPATVATATVMLLTAATCTGGTPTNGASTGTPAVQQNLSGTPQCAPSGTDLQVSAKGLLYQSAANVGPIACLAAPPGTPFTISFANQDAGVRHNVHILRGPRMYSINSPNLFKGAIFAGPATMKYRVPALPAGVWTFHCDLHPDSMNGAFIVPVEVTAKGLEPSAVEVTKGLAMAWWIPSSETRSHRLVDGSGAFGGAGGELDSGTLRPGGSYFFKFWVAGTYPILDRITGLVGLVTAPLTVTSNPDRTFTVKWAFDQLAAGFVADVQLMRPGSDTWTAFRTGRSDASAVFSPDRGAGTYLFRARLRNGRSGRSSGWSPPANVAVP